MHGTVFIAVCTQAYLRDAKPSELCNYVGVSLQNLRVRMVRGAGLALSFGKLPGSLCSKYMLVDGEKVMFGSYR